MIQLGEEFDAETGGAEAFGAAARHLRIVIAAGDPDLAGAGGQDGLRTGRRAAVMIAGFERHHDAIDLFGNAGVTGPRDGFGLGMRLPRPPMRAAGQFLPFSIEQHAADRRVGRRGAFMGPRQVQCMRHGTQDLLRRKM